MRRLLACSISVLVLTGLAAGCSSDKTVLQTQTTAASDSLPDISLPDISLPTGLTLPTGVTLPDFQNVDEAIKAVLDQLEASGVPLDRACMENLLKDGKLLEQAQAATAPTPELIQAFTKCLSGG